MLAAAASAVAANKNVNLKASLKSKLSDSIQEEDDENYSEEEEKEDLKTKAPSKFASGHPSPLANKSSVATAAAAFLPSNSASSAPTSSSSTSKLAVSNKSKSSFAASSSSSSSEDYDDDFDEDKTQEIQRKPANSVGGGKAMGGSKSLSALISKSFFKHSASSPSHSLSTSSSSSALSSSPSKRMSLASVVRVTQYINQLAQPRKRTTLGKFYTLEDERECKFKPYISEQSKELTADSGVFWERLRSYVSERQQKLKAQPKADPEATFHPKLEHGKYFEDLKSSASFLERMTEDWRDRVKKKEDRQRKPLYSFKPEIKTLAEQKGKTKKKVGGEDKKEKESWKDVRNDFLKRYKKDLRKRRKKKEKLAEEKKAEQEQWAFRPDLSRTMKHNSKFDTHSADEAEEHANDEKKSTLRGSSATARGAQEENEEERKANFLKKKGNWDNFLRRMVSDVHDRYEKEAYRRRVFNLPNEPFGVLTAPEKKRKDALKRAMKKTLAMKAFMHNRQTEQDEEEQPARERRKSF